MRSDHLHANRICPSQKSYCRSNDSMISEVVLVVVKIMNSNKFCNFIENQSFTRKFETVAPDHGLPAKRVLSWKCMESMRSDDLHGRRRCPSQKSYCRSNDSMISEVLLFLVKIMNFTELRNFIENERFPRTLEIVAPDHGLP